MGAILWLAVFSLLTNTHAYFSAPTVLRARARSPLPLSVVGTRHEATEGFEGEAFEGFDHEGSTETWSEDMQNGFDWELEKARRALSTYNEKLGFAPFRMDFWRPMEEEEKYELSPWDTAYIFIMNIVQALGGESIDGAPVAKIAAYEGSWLKFLSSAMSGRLEDLAGGPLFLMLERYFRETGPVYKLAFGPRSFIVVSDPVMAKHVLKANVAAYDKGVLAAILEPIMGKGLIPANPTVWKVRRRAIVPGFHKRWLNRMMRLFAECNDALLGELGAAADSGAVLDMEEKFCSVSLDIIGRAVFNYEFGSVSTESPVIKAVYRVLKEAEHRSSSFVPYWKLPFAKKWMDSQIEFSNDMEVLNSVLDRLIAKATATQELADIEELENRDLDSSEDPSLLRFLIDMRGEDATNSQLRDDLMTMLIAGHETTAAVLTWALFNLAQDPELVKRIQTEVDSVLGDAAYPTYDDLPKLQLTRLSLIEALRLYPEPPVLIRRALKEDVLPKGGSDQEVRLVKGTDVFISTWNLHRSPALWEEPEKYNPDRFMKPFSNPGVEGWGGYNPEVSSGLYPNEIATDFAFLPFGGGQRKCIGDQFAVMEATVTLSMLLKNFDFELAMAPEDVGMVTGATIHTAAGLNMTVKKRVKSAGGVEAQAHHAHHESFDGVSIGRAPEAGDEAEATTLPAGQFTKAAECPFH
ncbi:unnamed protein product [Chrysoparadoxa australica]